jgi:HEAT repeat protein
MRQIGLSVCVALLFVGCNRRGDDYSIAELMKRLQDGDATARYTAVSGLKGHGPAAKPARGLLSQALKDTDRNVRVEAIYALAAIGPDAESALPQLIETLKAQDVDVRLAGIYAVPIVGLRSNAALSATKAALNDRDPRVRAEAASGLRKIQLAARFKDAAATISVTANK